METLARIYLNGNPNNPIAKDSYTRKFKKIQLYFRSLNRNYLLILKAIKAFPRRTYKTPS